MSYDPNYVKWVQRSLNRIMKKNMAINGIRDRNGEYLGALREFKDTYDLKEAGLTEFQIGPKCQDEIIRFNNIGNDGGDYIAWLCKIVPGAPMHATSVIDQLQTAVRNFQKSEKLSVDGWVGYKTELRLIEKFKVDPPGTKQGDTPKGGGIPSPWVQWFNTLPPTKKYAYMMEIAAKQYAEGAWDPRLKCIAQKLRGLDNMGRVKNFFYFTTWKLEFLQRQDDLLTPYAKTGGMGYTNFDPNNPDVQRILVQNYMESTQALFKQYYYYPVGSMQIYEQNFNKFFDTIKKIHLDIDAGIGKIKTFKDNSHGEARMILAQKIVKGLMKNQYHIYGCFQDQMPGSVWDLEWLW